MEQVSYLDWNNSAQILEKAYETGLFVLIIGPKGTGKTSLVRDFAKKKGINLESINFSLRTRCGALRRQHKPEGRGKGHCLPG